MPAATAAAEPPRRAAGHARAVPRVQRRPVGGVLGRGAHRELVLVGLAQQRRAGGGQARDRRRRVRRAVALEDLRAGLARDALGAEQVLDADRDAAERRRRRRRRASSSSAHPGEGVERRRRRALAVEVARARRRRGRPPLPRSAACGGGQLEQLAHADAGPGLGTRKPPSAGVGRALQRDSRRGSDGRGSSARSAFSTSTTCEVGSTSARSPSSPIFSMWSSTFESSPAEALDLLLGQLEAGEAGDVQHLITAEHRRLMLGGGSRRRARAASSGRRAPRRTRRASTASRARRHGAARPSHAPRAAGAVERVVDQPHEHEQRRRRIPNARADHGGADRAAPGCRRVAWSTASAIAGSASSASSTSMTANAAERARAASYHGAHSETSSATPPGRRATRRRAAAASAAGRARLERVAQQHRDRHRADAAGHRRDQPRALGAARTRRRRPGRRRCG